MVRRNLLLILLSCFMIPLSEISAMSLAYPPSFVPATTDDIERIETPVPWEPGDGSELPSIVPKKEEREVILLDCIEYPFCVYAVIDDGQPEIIEADIILKHGFLSRDEY